MIFITQLIYLLDGQEDLFNQFESVALPIISKYNGKLLLRIRPDNESYIEHTIEKPYEIHLVEFDTDNDLNHFMQDEERKAILHLKEQSIRSVILIKGSRQ